MELMLCSIMGFPIKGQVNSYRLKAGQGKLTQPQHYNLVALSFYLGRYLERIPLLINADRACLRFLLMGVAYDVHSPEAAPWKVFGS